MQFAYLKFDCLYRSENQRLLCGYSQAAKLQQLYERAHLFNAIYVCLLNTFIVMGRLTRAKAAEFTETFHVDQDVLEVVDEAGEERGNTRQRNGERPPLGEITHNKKVHYEEVALKKSTCSTGKSLAKKCEKTGKNSFTTLDPSRTTTPPPPPEPLEVVPDENESSPSPASIAAAEDLMELVPGCEYLYFRHQYPGLRLLSVTWN